MSKAEKITGFINNFFEEGLETADKEIFASLQKSSIDNKTILN